MLPKHLLDIGLDLGLSDDDSLQYLKFHHKKYWGFSTILFLSFPKIEESELVEKSIKLKFKVKNQLSNDLTFICISELALPKRIERAKCYNSIILTRDELELIFNETEYHLHTNELLYDPSVAKDFRITKPLSNFNQDIAIESFSYNSENTYIVNLYKTTCTCKDFEMKERCKYPKGDIRRLCKHLLYVFKNSFGTAGLSELHRFIIEEGYPAKGNISSFILEKSQFNILVNYDSKDDWWNIFMKNEDGLYCRYGYSPIERRFANDNKPIGLVPELKLKLDELGNQLFKSPIKNDGVKANIDIPKGFIYIIVTILLIVILLLHLIC